MNHIMSVFADWGLGWKQTGKKKGEPDNIYSRVNWEQITELASIKSLSKEEKKRLMIDLISEKMLSAGGYISISDLSKLRVKFQVVESKELLPEKIIKSMMFVCHDKNLIHINRSPVYIQSLAEFGRFLEPTNSKEELIVTFRYAGELKKEIDRLEPTFELMYLFNQDEAIRKVEKIIQEEYTKVAIEISQFDVTELKRKLFESILRDNPEKAKEIENLMNDEKVEK